MNAPHGSAKSKVDPRPSLKGQYAGFTSRVMAFIIDMVLLIVAIVATGWFLKATFDLLQLPQFFTRVGAQFPLLGQIFQFITSPTATALFSLGLIIFYFVFLWTVAGQTIGKAVMGLRVVPLRGGKMKLGQSIIRYLGYYVSAVALGFGFIAILINDRRLGWHDRFARTCVIYVWDARPDERFLVRVVERLESQRQAFRLVSRRIKTRDQSLLPAVLPPIHARPNFGPEEPATTAGTPAPAEAEALSKTTPAGEQPQA
jgi:uncharacterized RDD family membrane protein YckC